MVKNLPGKTGDARDTGLIPGLGRSPGVGNGNLLQLFLPRKFHGQKKPGRLQFIALQRIRITENTHTYTHTMKTYVYTKT